MYRKSGREIWLLRHARARHLGPEMTDIERELTAEGIDQCRRISAWLQPRLAGQSVTLLVSPARRTQQTTGAVFSDWCRTTAQTEVSIWNAGAAALLQVVGNHPGDLVLVGHNPGLEQLQYRLTGQLLPLPTGGIFRLSLPPGDASRAELLESFQPDRD